MAGLDPDTQPARVREPIEALRDGSEFFTAQARGDWVAGSGPAMENVCFGVSHGGRGGEQKNCHGLPAPHDSAVGAQAQYPTSRKARRSHIFLSVIIWPGLRAEISTQRSQRSQKIREGHDGSTFHTCREGDCRPVWRAKRATSSSRPLRILRDLRVEIASLSVEFLLRWHSRAWHVSLPARKGLTALAARPRETNWVARIRRP
jgi:hypothetical protein